VDFPPRSWQRPTCLSATEAHIGAWVRAAKIHRLKSVLLDFFLSLWSLCHTSSRSCYNGLMTLIEITYELQSSLNAEQLRALGSFANTYGLRRFRVDEKTNRLSFEYDASRLKETEVAHVLRQANIPVVRRVEPTATVAQL